MLPCFSSDSKSRPTFLKVSAVEKFTVAQELELLCAWLGDMTLEDLNQHNKLCYELGIQRDKGV